ncbi:tetratricopeptide repeat-containing sulfotransferase family protein [Thalassotalea mangrovi]|uniref:Tetratricopeptide repeat protein n=1 Tax=Thalassotalea mangrovi TaxID=2572245 RepID=A0A4U1B542_9GAMM|nr:tetratricopeptide repeat-containing sulfotransferase family protein [Thalassotalea mangrovi]TKB44677.1 tetratricopeptide repeat protein [Thalassotalea mangrovi]
MTDFEHTAQIVKKNVSLGGKDQSIQALENLHQSNPQNKAHINQLINLYLQQGQIEKACQSMFKLLTLAPEHQTLFQDLLKFSSQQGLFIYAAKAIELVRLQSNDVNPNDYFNYGYYLAKSGANDDAVAAYQQALDRGVDKPEEVYVAIAQLLVNADRHKAITHLQKALSLKPDYIIAMFNLATLYEEMGNRLEAQQLLENILVLEPFHCDALSRLAELVTGKAKQLKVLHAIDQALNITNLNLSDKINLHYARAHLFDKLGQFDNAFQSALQANELNRQVNPQFDLEEYASRVKKLTAYVDGLSSSPPPMPSPVPVFICGMFRSGSTLLEQVLGCHSQITPAGELAFFTKLREFIQRNFSSGTNQVNEQMLSSWRNQYVELLSSYDSGQKLVTDKRPDNIVNIPLIKAMLPDAKFIITQRNPLDIALSVLFLRLGPSQSYATRVQDILDVCSVQQKWLQAFQEKYKDDIIVVKYEDMVTNFTETVTTLLGRLDLNFEPDCFNFHNATNAVQTASVWKVREPLFQTSLDKWKNYRMHLANHS